MLKFNFSKALLVVSMGIAAISFSGCLASSGIGATPEQQQQKLGTLTTDTHLADALSPMLLKKYRLNYYSKPDTIELSYSYFTDYSNGIKAKDYRDVYPQLIENSLMVKTYTEAVKNRGNTIVAFKNTFNSVIMESNVVGTPTLTQHVFNAAPCYMEFDKSGKVVSALANYAVMNFGIGDQLPNMNVASDVTFVVVVGNKARNILNRVGQKGIEDNKL